jgi:serine/threonine-protein kinase RCK2
VEGRSPGLATLKEAFDITYAVHRMEEEGARRRAYNGRGGAGQRGFLGGLNEDDEDNGDDEEVEDARRKHGDAVGRVVQEGGRQAKSGMSSGVIAAGYAVGERQTNVSEGGVVSGRAMWEEGRAGQRDRGGRRSVGVAASTGRHIGFELDIDGATLLGRRHKKGVEPSPLAGKPIGPSDGSGAYLPPGSPMRVT